MKNVNVKKLESAQLGIFQNMWGFWEQGHLQLKHNFTSNTLKKSSAGKYIRIFLS